jgi:hypothetical protein
MPNILQSLSLNSGLQIRKLAPQEQFHPVPEKYITIQAFGNSDSKNYDYFLDVIEYLRHLDYEILHIGQDCPPLPHCQNLLNLNFNQINYVIRNSSLHLGGDCYSVHLAGVHNIPVVALYGPTSPSSHGPHFGENKILIESDRGGKNPTFATQESPKTINLIKPEEVANAVLKLLGKDSISDETIFIGKDYGKHYIELIPNSVVNPQSLGEQVPTIRCDYEYDENILAQNLSAHKYSIITDKETNLDLYRQFRENIQTINYKVDMECDMEYVKKLRNIGVETRLWTDDLDNLNDIRFRFLDIEQIHLVEYKYPEIEIPDGAKYKSFKYLLSNGKIYMSKQDWLDDRPIENPQKNTLEIGNKSVDFLRELEYLRIIK